MQTIKGVEEEYRVQVTIKPQASQIRVYGLPECIIQSTDVIDRVIKEAIKHKYEEEQGRLISEFIQWKYEVITESGRELEPYPEEINALIENAYRHQHDFVRFKDNSNVEFEINFSTRKEYATQDGQSMEIVTVVRQDKIVNNGENVSFPQSWGEMPQDDNVALYFVDSQSPEYQEVENKFRSTLGDITDTITIVKIQRVQNKGLFKQYMAKQMVINKHNPGVENERILWHGTAADAEESINFNGFNRSFCGKNAIVYGQGVYFAVNSRYSAEPSGTYAPEDASGNRRIYQCKVLTGEYTTGDQTMRVAPLKGSHRSLRYDSVVDDEEDPEIFVIFHDSQAYPEYLITFKSS